MTKQQLLLLSAKKSKSDSKFQFVIDTNLGSSTTFVVPFTKGTYTTINKFLIDWGDNSVTTIKNVFTTENCTHNYAEHGVYTITFYNSDKICPPFAFANTSSAMMLVEFDMRNQFNFVTTSGSLTYTLPSYYLYGCRNFESEVFISENIIGIGGLAFNSCQKMTGEIIIPNGVTTITGNQFRNCYKVTKLILHNGMTSIAPAFQGNSQMSVYSYMRVPITTDAAAFSGAKNELHVPFGTTSLYAELTDWNRFTNIIDDL